MAITSLLPTKPLLFLTSHRKGIISFFFLHCYFFLLLWQRIFSWTLGTHLLQSVFFFLPSHVKSFNIYSVLLCFCRLVLTYVSCFFWYLVQRTAPGPVVGWPPVRSFRKNLASTSSSKLGNESSHGGQINKSDDGEKQVETKKEGMFVKINMDGVPIGRKVDLNAYNSYEQLSFVVDKLFRGLLAG